MYRSRGYGRESSLQRLKGFRCWRSCCYLSRAPSHLILDLHGAFGERLSDGAVLGSSLKPDPLRFRNPAFQGDQLPNSKPNGIRKLNRFHFKIDLNVLQGDIPSVGHAHHCDHGSSGPSRHRQVLGRRPNHIKAGVWDAGYERPWPPRSWPSANHREHCFSSNGPGNNTRLNLVRHPGTRAFNHESPQRLFEIPHRESSML